MTATTTNQDEPTISVTKKLVEIAHKEDEERKEEEDNTSPEATDKLNKDKNVSEALNNIAANETQEALKDVANSVLEQEKGDVSASLQKSAEQVLGDKAGGEEALIEIAKESAEQDDPYKDDEFTPETDTLNSSKRQSLLASKAWQKLYKTSEPSKRKTNNTKNKSRARRGSIDSTRDRLSRTGSFRQSKKQPNTSRKYDKEDDAKNCTFQPKINKSSRQMIRNSGPFLQRFESAHESKNHALEAKRGKKEYEARVDKKVCPSCNATQSYDEFKNHKNKCRDCKVPFRHKLLWQDVGNSFIERMEAKMEEREEKRADIEAKTAPEFRPQQKTVYDPERGITRTVKPVPVPWEYVQGSFMRRMENDAKRRETKRVLAERDGMLGPEYTFTPDIFSARSDFSCSSYDLSMLDDTFEERMEQDVHRRQRERAQNVLRSKYQPDLSEGSRTFKTNSAWDDSNSFSGGQRRNPSGRWV